MKAVIDRFEGEYAVVLFGDGEVRVNIPKKLLPQNVREGSLLKATFELDPESERKQREKIEGLLKKLYSKSK